MLRESSKANAESVDLAAVMDGSEAHNIEHGDALIQLAEGVVSGDEKILSAARDAVVAGLGAEAMVDAIGVATNFMRMVRIADSTGIALGVMESITEDLREELGINQFADQKSH